MKTLLKFAGIIAVMLVLLSASGCQYLLPPVIRGGSVEIQKQNAQKTPESTQIGETITIEIDPPEDKP